MAEPSYTVFVRVPIPRGDFVDPPHVSWDPTKDDALWKILSLASQTEIDWNKVAQRFDVPVNFLLQQVAYLTERHASQVRAQVRKATAAAKGGSGAPSPIPGFDTSSALRMRKDSLAVPGEGSGAQTPVDTWARPLPARSASTNTAVVGEAGASSPKPTKGVQAWAAEQMGRRRMSSLPIIGTNHHRRPTLHDEKLVLRETSPGPAETESTATSDEEDSPAQSRIIRRPPRFSHQQELSTYDEDEDEESEPAFQPYRPSRDENHNSTSDLTSTLRGGLNQGGSRRSGAGRAGKEPDRHSQTSDSDTNSPALVQRPGSHREQRNPGVLSPRRTAELAGRNSSSKTTEGSDGTPSMGSSYSDLDDASVTQSALEEALASHMGNRGSRFSISHAFRSRYTPGGN